MTRGDFGELLGNATGLVRELAPQLVNALRTFVLCSYGSRNKLRAALVAGQRYAVIDCLAVLAQSEMHRRAALFAKLGAGPIVVVAEETLENEHVCSLHASIVRVAQVVAIAMGWRMAIGPATFSIMRRRNIKHCKMRWRGRGIEALEAAAGLIAVPVVVVLLCRLALRPASRPSSSPFVNRRINVALRRLQPVNAPLQTIWPQVLREPSARSTQQADGGRG